MVEQPHIDEGQRLLQLGREVPVGGAWLRHAARVVVGDDDGGRIHRQRALDDDAWVHGSGVDGALEQDRFGDDPVAVVEEQRGEALAGRPAKPAPEVVAGMPWAGQWVAANQFGLQMATSQRERARQQGGTRAADAGQAQQLLRRLVEQGAQATAAVDQGLRVRQDVAPARPAAKEEGEQFGIGECVGTQRVQALARPIRGWPVMEAHGSTMPVGRAARRPIPPHAAVSSGLFRLSGPDVVRLREERVLLGVTGGIAAYKAADLVRRLRDAGAEVRVVMSAGAEHFITATTLQALSGHPVRTSLWDAAAEAAMGHIELARWATRVLVAPATADFIARLSHGRADDLLSTLCLASEAPIAIAPAMNRVMWANAATRANVALLRQRGVAVFGPESGGQACGEVGEGRMREPMDLVSDLAAARPESGPPAQGARLEGRRVLVSAGPTYEDLDPVRFLGNRSSGRMGFAIAEAAVAAGADVTLIAGPVKLASPASVRRIDVRSAAEMRAAVLAALPGQDAYVGAAAIADYRPVEIADRKIKKGDGTISLVLERTSDVLAEVALHPQRPRCVLGFAAETHDIETYALAKLAAKKLDAIAANRVGVDGSGFDADDNALTLYWQGGEKAFATAPKADVARGLVEWMADWLARA